MDEKLQKLLTLMTEQAETLQREFGILVTKTRNLVDHPGNPNNETLRPEVQARVNHLMQGSLLLYLFAMWECNGGKEVEDLLDEDDLLRLRAYQHLRHSAGHGYKGKRARQCRREFEQVMEGPHPLQGVVWDREGDTINLSGPNPAHSCLQFMQKITPELVSRLASQGQ